MSEKTQGGQRGNLWGMTAYFRCLAGVVAHREGWQPWAAKVSSGLEDARLSCNFERGAYERLMSRRHSDDQDVSIPLGMPR